jgi:hypothetical protein
MTPAPRKQIGRNVGAMTREAIFETADAIEVESREGYEVTRKRVLYEEVLLVTFHRTLGVPYAITMAVMTLLFGGLALIFLLVSHEPAFAIAFGIVALPFLIALVVRVALKLDFVTVFGRRSKAVLRFAIRKQRAREVYGRICSRTMEVQRAMAEPEPAAVPIDEPPAPPVGDDHI